MNHGNKTISRSCCTEWCVQPQPTGAFTNAKQKCTLNARVVDNARSHRFGAHGYYEVRPRPGSLPRGVTTSVKRCRSIVKFKRLV